MWEDSKFCLEDTPTRHCDHMQSLVSEKHDDNVSFFDDTFVLDETHFVRWVVGLGDAVSSSVVKRSVGRVIWIEAPVVI